jgi:hypothetical protein
LDFGLIADFVGSVLPAPGANDIRQLLAESTRLATNVIRRLQTDDEDDDDTTEGNNNNARSINGERS